MAACKSAIEWKTPRRRLAQGSGQSNYDWSNGDDANGYACPPIQPGGEDLCLWAEDRDATAPPNDDGTVPAIVAPSRPKTLRN